MNILLERFLLLAGVWLLSGGCTPIWAMLISDRTREDFGRLLGGLLIIWLFIGTMLLGAWCLWAGGTSL